MATATTYPEPRRSPAPWAEVVPGRGPTMVEELLSLPDDGYAYEVDEGVLVRMGGSGNRATRLAVELVGELRAYVRPRRLGVVTGADGVYKFAGAETGLIPDVGYYVASHLPDIVDEDKPIPFAPDLAVEVVSPDQSARAMATKARTYLRGGTRLVWVIWPQSEHIDVWRGNVVTGPVRYLGMTGSLDGEDVIPGFTYPVAELFADPLRPDQSET